MSKYNYSIFMGRMQPPHKAHIHAIETCLSISERVIILIGSANQPRTVKNPWTWQEREQMIRAHFNERQNSRILCRGMEDYLYNDQRWVRAVQDVVDHIQTAVGDERSTVLVGRHKDASSYYLDLFPQWVLYETEEYRGEVTQEPINATDVRTEYFVNDWGGNFSSKELLSPTSEFLTQFADTEDYQYVLGEKDFLDKHNKMWEGSPYTPTFNCADAIVIQSGHVLLVKRRASPGKNLYAIPGGYIDGNEGTLDAAIRELREETKLKVPDPVLRGSIFGSRVFDHPQRSQRGRVFSHSYGFLLKGSKLPPVKGGSDAEKAKWFTLDQAMNMRDQFFEDHFDILYHYLGLI